MLDEFGETCVLPKSIFISAVYGYKFMGGSYKMKYAQLVDLKNNHIVAIFRFSEKSTSEFSISGDLYRITAWYVNPENEPSDSEFFANASVKSDGCSTISFVNKDADGSLHVCGARNYIMHSRLLAFIFNLMVEHVGEKRLYKNDLEDDLLKLLEGYKITYEPLENPYLL